MLGGQGYYRGSSILVSGTAGTGKTSLAAAFRRRRLPARRAVPVLRLRGIARADHPQHALHRLRPGARGSSKGLLQFHAARPTLYGLEMHLVDHAQADRRSSSPRRVVIDPITNLTAVGDDGGDQGDADAADRLPEEPGRSPRCSPA